MGLVLPISYFSVYCILDHRPFVLYLLGQSLDLLLLVIGLVSINFSSRGRIFDVLSHKLGRLNANILQDQGMLYPI